MYVNWSQYSRLSQHQRKDFDKWAKLSNIGKCSKYKGNPVWMFPIVSGRKHQVRYCRLISLRTVSKIKSYIWVTLWRHVRKLNVRILSSVKRQTAVMNVVYDCTFKCKIYIYYTYVYYYVLARLREYVRWMDVEGPTAVDHALIHIDWHRKMPKYFLSPVNSLLAKASWERITFLILYLRIPMSIPNPFCGKFRVSQGIVT